MNKALTAVAAIAVGALGWTSIANANPIIGGTYNLWNALTSGQSGTNQQGGPDNSIISGPHQLVTNGSYTGPINFNLQAPAHNETNSTIGDFLASDSSPFGQTGCNSNCLGTTLSQGSFHQVSLFEFTFNVGAGGENLSVLNDDGVSLFEHGHTTNLFGAGSEDPTANGSNFATLAAGSYDLWYAEANGDPAVLQTNVPEPATIAIFGSALIGLGALRRRRRRDVA